ncbi:MAG TPA: IPT/TIG domain-containing protein [Acidimicrobiales bacterium]|nr:IPT/TIG domain-containing protein [Acidimicrobiales bacterium]
MGLGLGFLGAIVVVLAAVTIGVSVHSNSTSAPLTSPSGGSTTVPGSISTSSTSSAAAPGAPSISTLTPSSGSAGQAIVVSGTNLMSPDGHVEVRFGGQVAPTSCPTSSACTATVPASPVGARVPVTVGTAAGTSNGLWFTYE